MATTEEKLRLVTTELAKVASDAQAAASAQSAVIGALQQQLTAVVEIALEVQAAAGANAPPTQAQQGDA